MNIPWRTLLLGLPKRRFTAEELARAVPDAPSTAMVLSAVLNIVAVYAQLPLLAAGRYEPVPVLLSAVMALLLLWGLRQAWADPSNPWLRRAYYAAPVVVMIGVILLMEGRDLEPRGVALVFAISSVLTGLMLWFAIVYRHQFVALRLAELDERDRAVGLARQLANAQIQPHFLFNSLASLQHWVATRDERALPMLEAITGYLRATLPLFERELLALGDELQAVRRYLEIMRMRLGDRLQVVIDMPPEALDQRIPPALLLTLVENAIEHGVLPSLRPVTLRIAARRVSPAGSAPAAAGGTWELEIDDDGAGWAPSVGTPAHVPAGRRGLGLISVRERLAQVWGPRAGLHIGGAPGQGCRATVHWPADPPSLPGAPA